MERGKRFDDDDQMKEKRGGMTQERGIGEGRKRQNVKKVSVEWVIVWRLQ